MVILIIGMDEVLLIFSGQEANGQEGGRFHTTKYYPTTSKLFMIREKLIYNYVNLEFKYIFHINTMYSCRLLICAEVFKNVKFGTFSRAVYHFSSPVQKNHTTKENTTHNISNINKMHLYQFVQSI